MTEGLNTNQIRVAHVNQYGFDVTDNFANDLAAYVRNPAKTPGMLASGNVQRVIETIRDVYHVRVTAAYANDLLAFAEKGGKEE